LKFNKIKTVQCQKEAKCTILGQPFGQFFFWAFFWLDYEIFQLVFFQAPYVHCVVMCFFHVECFAGLTSRWYTCVMMDNFYNNILLLLFFSIAFVYFSPFFGEVFVCLVYLQLLVVFCYGFLVVSLWCSNNVIP
jgi:hypothetical protein